MGGARVSFEEYVAEQGPALLRLAFLLCGDRTVAEDLVQSALLDAYRNWHRVERAQQPDAYVRRILLNTLLSWRRRRSWTERPTVTGDLPEPTGRPAPFLAGEDPADRLADRDTVWRMLHRLPPRARAVLVLRFYEDADDATIAALLGMAPSSVRATASRALATLRSAVGPGALTGSASVWEVR